MLTTQTHATPLGDLTLLSDDQALLGVWFSDQKYFGAGYDLTQAQTGTTSPLEQAGKWLDRYFARAAPSPADLPLRPEVTAFRASVLQVLRQVPYGTTITYQQIADQLARNDPHERNAARAVGGAVGHNPLSIVIPCHRVVGSDGSLTGYAGGLDRKVALLQLEGVVL